MTHQTQPYAAPRWLPGGHLQTIYPALLAPTLAPHYRRDRWELDDGDFLDLDWITGPADAPLVCLFHGLEGGSQSFYARALMAGLSVRRWQGVVVHFRGCSGEPNRLPRAYFAGDSAETGRILSRLSALAPDVPRFAAGVSLGGNALLRWLGETGTVANRYVAAAAAISAPVDLLAAGDHLDRGFNRLTYTRHFLNTLKPKAQQKLARWPGLFDGRAVARARTLREFDNLYTAPLHGYSDAQDYWTRASSKPLLHDISVPTLLLNARNDPFLPANALPGRAEVSRSVTLEQPRQGGHVGFLRGAPPGQLDWLPGRLLAHFDATLAGHR